jgi:uncharacterized protein YciI
MKWLLVLLVACSPPPPPAKPAGQLQMKQYVFVVLRRGPAWTADETPETRRLFEGHMANIQAMARAGKLILAGPMDAPATDTTAIAGIFVFDNVDRAGVEQLLVNDPAIAAHRLVPEYLSWYGPAGLTYPGKL